MPFHWPPWLKPYYRLGRAFKKANYELSLTIPEEWNAVSHYPVAEESAENGSRTIRYERTQVISTYLFAFAAGKFEAITDTVGNRTMTLTQCVLVWKVGDTNQET